MIDNVNMLSGGRDIHQAILRPTSKHRHKEPEYWLNKLTKRRKLAKIARKSRQKNAR